MLKLMFLCTGNSARSQMAEAFAKARAGENVYICSAGVNPAPAVNPFAVRVMREAGVDISAYVPKPLAEPGARAVDILVTLCGDAARECVMLLPGHPAQVDWRLDDPAVATGGEEEKLAAFRRSRDRIRQLVDDLFDRGYLRALAWVKRQGNLILDSLQEGIIAHDLRRRIVFFNGAAEAITGYSREEVLGRDCHDVFPGNFCGNQCAFCGDAAPAGAKFGNARYNIEISTKIGEKRQLEMSVQPIVAEETGALGVLASFRDLTREREMARRLGEVESFSGIVGRDKKMLEVFDLIRSVAASTAPVLIQGASGTGKELVAAAIHNESPRAANLFVPVNCGALPDGLLESELFGHVRGAFTGATRDKKGRFELADSGTIFLDEIGDISPAMQVKLLRVLQEGEFERVGDTRTLRVDVRVISATNKDLQAEIAAGRFREDLYYRLCVVPVSLPPLRERCGDIPLLVEKILERLAEREGKAGMRLSAAALDALLSYSWPGNVRELQNALQFALVKCREGEIELRHLPPHIVASSGAPPAPARNVEPEKPAAPAAALPRQIPTTGKPGRPRVLTVAAVEQALADSGGNKAAAAKLLGVGRATLYRFLSKQ